MTIMYGVRPDIEDMSRIPQEFDQRTREWRLAFRLGQQYQSALINDKNPFHFSRAFRAWQRQYESTSWRNALREAFQMGMQHYHIRPPF